MFSGSPEEIEGLGASLLHRTEIFAPFVGTADSAIRVEDRRMWNRVLTGRSGEVEQPGKFRSNRMSDLRPAIEKGGGRKKCCHLDVPTGIIKAGENINMKVSLVEGIYPNLKHLNIYGCNDLVEVGALPPTLIILSVRMCSKVRKMEGLYNLRNLQELDIHECKELEELSSFDRLTSLKTISLYGCDKVRKIEGLDNLTNLQTLTSRGVKSWRSCPVLKG